MLKLRTAVASIVGIALAVGTQTVASADSLPTAPDSQDFTASAGGWTSEAAYSGLCIPLLTCASVSNTFQAADGASGAEDGYISAGFGSLLSLVTGTSSSVWTSPEFVYDGVGGRAAESVLFDMSIRPDVGALLGVDLGNTSSYEVALVSVADSTEVTVVPETMLSASTVWAAIPAASINPGALVTGSSYQLQITTKFNSVAAVLASGSVGYDNVSLTTMGANGPSGVTTSGQLTKLIKTTVVPDKVSMAKGKIKVKLRCPKVAKPTSCVIKAQGLAKGKSSRPGTKAEKVKVAPGKAKIVKLKVKKNVKKRYLRTHRVWLRTTVTVGIVKSTVVKEVKIRR